LKSQDEGSKGKRILLFSSPNMKKAVFSMNPNKNVTLDFEENLKI